MLTVKVARTEFWAGVVAMDTRTVAIPTTGQSEALAHWLSPIRDPEEHHTSSCLCLSTNILQTLMTIIGLSLLLNCYFPIEDYPYLKVHRIIILEEHGLFIKNTQSSTNTLCWTPSLRLRSKTENLRTPRYFIAPVLQLVSATVLNLVQ
jgi:hypothetical protein